MDIQVNIAERSVRFLNLLPAGKDKELVVLKGHLLIEEIITEILRASLGASNPVGICINRNMSFAQKLKICWALNRKMTEESVWSSVKELNSIRNSMAHSLEPQGLEEVISKFCNSVLPNSEFKQDDYLGRELEFSISWLHIVLNQYFHDLKNI